MFNFKNPFVILLVGTPLSGKSTWIVNNLPHVSTICRDNIILQNSKYKDYDSAFDDVNQKEIDKILEDKIIEISKNNKNVIIDMTHLSKKRRKRNLAYFSKNYQKIAIVFPILSDKEYILRNSIRSRLEGKDIPLSLIKNMLKHYNPVTLCEDFNKIIIL